MQQQQQVGLERLRYRHNFGESRTLYRDHDVNEFKLVELSRTGEKTFTFDDPRIANAAFDHEDPEEYDVTIERLEQGMY